MDRSDSFGAPDTHRLQTELAKTADPAVDKSKGSEMVRLTVVYPPEDIFLEAVLQQADIFVIKKKESIASVQGISFGPLAEVEIYVPKHQVAEALEILASLAETEES